MTQIKHYAQKNGLWIEPAFSTLFNSSRLLKYSAMYAVLSGVEKDCQLFFVHKGSVLGTEEGKQNYNRVILAGEIFGDFGAFSDLPFPKFSWTAMDRAILTGTSLKNLREKYGLAGVELQLLGNHLISLEMRRSAFYSSLLPLHISGKMDYLENNAPGLLFGLKWKYLASFLNVTPETLSREITKRSG